jgi:hypothetical protein
MTETLPGKSTTAAGEVRETVVPSPNWPKLLLPQQ